MRIATGTVIDGKVVVQGEALPEGAVVTILARETAEHDAWFRRQVQMGIDEADAGKVVPDEEVEAEAAAWRSAIQRGSPGADS